MPNLRIIYTHRESLVRNHEPCAKALGNYYIYIYVCHASAHAQDNNNNYYLYIRAMGRYGIFPAKVWHAAAFSCNGSRRALSLPRASLLTCCLASPELGSPH